MSTIRLTLVVPTPEPVLGESFDVKVTVLNASAAPISMPGADAPCPFQFILRDARDPAKARVIDPRAALVARTGGDPLPPWRGEPITIAPGAAVDYMADLASYVTSPLQPGAYQVTAAYGVGEERVESAPVAVRWVPLRVRSFAAVATADGTGSAFVIAHDTPAGRIIFHQENRQQSPADAVRYRRAQTEPTASVSGVAVAAEPADSDGVRWYAWLHDQAISGGVAQLRTVFKTVPPTGLDLRGGRLLPVGWQETNQAAVFLALGVDQRGQVQLAHATLHAADGTTAIRRFDLGLDRMPEHASVRWSSGRKSGFFLATATNQQDASTVRLTASGDGGMVRAGAVVLERRKPVVALTPSGFADGAPVIDLLFGPDAEGQMNLVRLDLAAQKVTQEWTFKLPPAATQPLTTWVLPSRALPEPLVAALEGDRLWLCRVAESSWREITKQAAGADNLRLDFHGDRLYVIWSDAVAGVNFKASP